MPLLHIDSRFRTPSSTSTVSNASFTLTRPAQNVHRARVRSVSFFNNFNNINVDNDTLATSSGYIVLPHAFYTASELESALEQQLSTLFATPYTPGTYVTLNTSNNTLDWTLGVNTIDGVSSSLAQTLGLPRSAVLIGTFTTPLHLAFPAYISLSSPQFITAESNVHAGRASTHIQVQPFVSIPISSGYLSQQVHEPNLSEPWITFTSPRKQGITLSHIDVRLVDPSSGRELTEATHWSTLIEFE